MTHDRRHRLLMMSCALLAMCGTACEVVLPIDPDNPDPTTLTIVKTAVAVRHDAGLKVGNDLIAFGTSATTGVSHITPSTAPTDGTPVPNTENYDNSDFAVAGRTIFLVGHVGSGIAFRVSVFNADTATITQTFPATSIRLRSIPASANDPGNIQASGNYCVVSCDTTQVADGKAVKVIDVSGATPALIAFANNPPDPVRQVAVDGTTRRVVAVAGSSFYVYDINNPATAPTAIASPNGIGDLQMKIYGRYVVAVDNRAFPQVILVDLQASAIINLTDAEAVFGLAISEDTFAFFADYDANDRSGGSQRVAVGTIPGPAFAKPALAQYIDGSTTNNGMKGFAGSLCMTPNGNLIFLGNSYLQSSTGNTTFTVLADPAGTDAYGCPAWAVDCSSNTVGFMTAATRTSAATTRTIGYIRLP